MSLKGNSSRGRAPAAGESTTPLRATTCRTPSASTAANCSRPVRSSERRTSSSGRPWSPAAASSASSSEELQSAKPLARLAKRFGSGTSQAAAVTSGVAAYLLSTWPWLTSDQVKAIAEQKMPDLNTTDVEAAMRTVAGTARSMGLDVID